jgi:hypothetical protein
LDVVTNLSNRVLKTRMSETQDLQLSTKASAENSPTEASEARTQPHTHTRARQDLFLEAYAILGNVVATAEATGIGRRTHYDWMKADAEYKQRFDEADTEYIDSIRNELRVRGLEGWMEPIVYKGRIQFIEEFDENGEIKLDPKTGRPIAHVVAVRRKSDRILELLAKAKVPECKDKIELNAGGTLAEIIARSYEQNNAKP